jgi:hypothetical protein
MPGPDEGLAALEPDLIGEHHVLRVMTDGLLNLLFVPGSVGFECALGTAFSGGPRNHPRLRRQQTLALQLFANDRRPLTTGAAHTSQQCMNVDACAESAVASEPHGAASARIEKSSAQWVRLNCGRCEVIRSSQ